MHFEEWDFVYIPQYGIHIEVVLCVFAVRCTKQVDFQTKAHDTNHTETAGYNGVM